MKSEQEIQAAADKVDTTKNPYPGQTYSEGVRSALEWVLGDIEDDEMDLDALS